MKSIVMWVAAAGVAFAQAEFEVASIRPANQTRSQDISTDTGRFQTRDITLKTLIGEAYGIDVREIFGGPKWVDSDGFDINAKIPDEFAHGGRQEKLPQMIQSLLAARFELVIHREPREMSGYELVVGKNGLKMEAAKTSDQGRSLHSGNTHMKAENITMETLAKHLSYEVDKLVVDKTGLTGGFNFELEWMPARLDTKAEASPEILPSIFTALQEQLGLRLESAQVPIQAIVIDRAERPEEN
jgi:uncharacterized protein (TIGR03435 family)